MDMHPNHVTTEVIIVGLCIVALLHLVLTVENLQAGQMEIYYEHYITWMRMNALYGNDDFLRVCCLIERWVLHKSMPS